MTYIKQCRENAALEKTLRIILEEMKEEFFTADEVIKRIADIHFHAERPETCA